MVIDILLCILAADFISGIIHWLEDTYAVPGKSKFLDKHIVLPNIDHHRNPGYIVRGTYLSNVLVSVILCGLAGLALYLAGIRFWQPYLTLLIASQANQTHAWAHTRRVPKFVRYLQSFGALQSTFHHSEHHYPPYDIKYCTITNCLNPLLDRVNFWRFLERCIPIKVKRGSAERSNF
jgi:hypothetical protein